MKSTEQVEQLLRQELNQLSNNKLRKVATDMGVTRVTYKTREELIEQCVVLELYAFTHREPITAADPFLKELR